MPNITPEMKEFIDMDKFMKMSMDTASRINKMYESFNLGNDLLQGLERDPIIRFYGIDSYILETYRNYSDVIEKKIQAIYDSFFEQSGILMKDKEKPK